MNSFIVDLSVLFLVVLVISFVIKLLRQPIILGYIVSGLIFSLLFVQNNQIESYILVFSELGITFLLFLIGLEFNFKSFKDIGKDIVIVTTIQSLIFFITAFLFSRFFALQIQEAAYISVLFMFSSTLLVAKWIEDKKDTHALYGRIVLGILVVQDILAIASFVILNMSGPAEANKMVFLPLGGLALFLVSYISSKYILNPIIKFTLKYPELMFVFSIGVCFFFVKIASLLGYTSTMGAFIGGLVLANTIYKNDIYARLKPLILFFSMLFFVGLGFQLDLSTYFEFIVLAIGLSVLGLLSKPLVIYVTLRIRGYDLKTSLRSGLNLAQFSEFGIIIVLTGISGGFISSQIGTVAILAVAITMIISSYLIKYDDKITNVLTRYFNWFDILFPETKKSYEKVDFDKYHFVFIGYDTLSKDIFSRFHNLKEVLVIENDPANLAILKKEGIPHIYNSLTNHYFFDSLKLGSVNLLVSNLTEVEDNLMVLKKLKGDNPKSHMIVTAKSLKDSLTLYEAGADYVLYSKDINETHLSVLIEDYSKDINKLLEKKIKDVERLMKKQEIKKESDKIHFYNWNTYLKILSGKKLEDTKDSKSQP